MLPLKYQHQNRGQITLLPSNARFNKGSDPNLLLRPEEARNNRTDPTVTGNMFPNLVLMDCHMPVLDGYSSASKRTYNRDDC